MFWGRLTLPNPRVQRTPYKLEGGQSTPWCRGQPLSITGSCGICHHRNGFLFCHAFHGILNASGNHKEWSCCQNASVDPEVFVARQESRSLTQGGGGQVPSFYPPLVYWHLGLMNAWFESKKHWIFVYVWQSQRLVSCAELDPAVDLALQKEKAWKKKDEEEGSELIKQSAYSRIRVWCGIRMQKEALRRRYPWTHSQGQPSSEAEKHSSSTK